MVRRSDSMPNSPLITVYLIIITAFETLVTEKVNGLVLNARD
jgi:hypothetical protein